MIQWFIMKYESGLIIGRFQPLHNGHLHLITDALKICRTVTIGVGSAYTKNAENPFTYGQREHMLTIMTAHEHLNARIPLIFPIDDVPDDTDWLRDVMLQSPHSQVVFGNNEWVNGIFEEAGIPVVRPELYHREEYEGAQIRSLIKAHDNSWKTRVPQYIAVYLEDVLDRTPI